MLVAACSPVTAVGLKFLYRRADLPADRIISDVCYVPSNCQTEANKLDLFLPTGKDWPVIVFVHGGGWNEGDKQLRVESADVYANIGRFYASHGIGVASINYRLQPTADWRGQVEDVRRAARWVHDNIKSYGGNPKKIFLMGHSAGAHLASFVALDTNLYHSINYSGVIAVSGAALDLSDQQTYDLGEDVHYYEKRFQGEDTTDHWKQAASPASYVYPSAPPFLLMYAGGEKKGLQRQSERMKELLDQNKVENKLVVVPGENHQRIVLTLSRSDKTAAPAIFEFIKKHS